jgi:hypothetical protein
VQQLSRAQKIVPAVLLRFIVLPNVSPPSVDLLYNISKSPGVASTHITCTLLPDSAISGEPESSELLLMFTTLPNSVPPSRPSIHDLYIP